MRRRVALHASHPPAPPAADVLARAARMRPNELRRAVAHAIECARHGCATCARDAELYMRAFIRLAAADEPEPDSRRSARDVAVDPRRFPPARAAAKPRAALSYVRTSTSTSTRKDPPLDPPLQGRADRDPLRRPTRAERARAILTRERYRVITEDHNPCRHEPTCQTEEECIGRLVEYSREELAAGQRRERAIAHQQRSPATWRAESSEPVPQLLDLSFTRRPRGKRRPT